MDIDQSSNTPLHGEITERAANQATKQHGPVGQHTVTILHGQATGKPTEDGKKEVRQMT